MGTEKRERQKSNRDARRAAAAAAEARRRRIRFIRNAIILVIVLIVVGFLLAGCGDAGDGVADNTDAEPGSEAATADQDQTSNGDQGAGQPSYGTGECPPVDGADGGADEVIIDFDAAFERCIDPAQAYTAEVETTEGAITVELDTDRTPITTNNFVALARSGYYTDTDLFRTEAPTGIIQGGSPHTQANDDPGPGYTIDDEGLPFAPDDYGPGTLAMARTAQPNSAGGQFFLLASEGGRYLGDPDQLGDAAGTYAAFGEVTEGLDVLEAIAALDDGSGAPGEPVAVTSVTISEA